MIFYVLGLCAYSIFDFFDLLEKSKIHEKIIFAFIFFCALVFGIYYFSEYAQPSLTKSLIEFFNMRNIKY